jgi:hypothetical protein
VQRLLIITISTLTLLLQAQRLCAQEEAQSLDQAASDPTASLMNLQIGDWYTASTWQAPGETANLIALRSAYPFRWGDTSHIFRVTAPIVTDHPVLDSGLSDLTVFDLVVFDQPWGRWGVGPVALLPTGGSTRGAEQWAVGPAVGFIVTNPGLIWGFFNQNLFTVTGDAARPDVDVSIIQPIVNRQLGKGWSLGTSEMSITWDWNDNDWASLPLGFSLAKLTRPGGVPVQWSLQYEYNFADQFLNAKSTVRFTAKLLFPTL